MENEKRLIPVEKLEIVLEKKFRNGMIHYDDLMAAIADIPAAEAEPVAHGRWLTNRSEIEVEYICDQCGMTYCEADPTEKPFKYCPECGSKNE